MQLELLDHERWVRLYAAWPDREVFAHPDYIALFAGPRDRVLAAYATTPAGWILYPFILREAGNGLTDITNAYGYGGPFMAGDAASHADEFWRAFDEWAHRERVVSEFLRFSLFDEHLLPYPGEREQRLVNIVRSLAPSADEIWADYDHKVRKNVNKARRSGVTIEVDTTGARQDEFLKIYFATMDRRDAERGYYFPRSFFEAINKLVGQFAYFHAVREGVVVSTELVLVSAHNVYSFLGGTDESAFDYRPNDLLKHEMFLWAKQQGKSRVVLGGGYSLDDGIFRYKKAFAPTGQKSFYVGCRVLDRDRYDQLVAARVALARSVDLSWSPDPTFFPAYRAKLPETLDLAVPRVTTPRHVVTSRLLTPDDPEWQRITSEGPHDIYHRPEYARIDAGHTAHKALAVWLESGKYGLLVPLLRRAIPALPGAYDAISPYGYAGPLWWRGEVPDADLRKTFSDSLREALGAESIVSVLLRLHPLLNGATAALEDLGAIVDHGETVPVHLTTDWPTIKARMRQTHRNEIAQAEREGIEIIHDPHFEHLDAFLALYHATMRRVRASDTYLFQRAYFERLRDDLPGRCHLFVARKQGTVAAASVFFEEDGIVQYHLSAMDPDLASSHASKLLLARAIYWARERNNRWLHLGGGVGARADGVFQFKVGFSPLRWRYRTLRIVVDEARYRSLSKLDATAPLGMTDEFFPIYRTADAS